MIYYESLLLLQPSVSQDFFTQLKDRLTELITSAGGELKTFDRWGKYLLSYKIRKNAYGIYVLVRFGTPDASCAELLKKIGALLQVKYYEEVMRHIMLKLGKKMKAEYSRPDSLEDAPRRDGVPMKNGEKIRAPYKKYVRGVEDDHGDHADHADHGQEELEVEVEREELGERGGVEEL